MYKVSTLHLAGSRMVLSSRTMDRMKIIFICTAEHTAERTAERSSHKPHVASEHLKWVWRMEEPMTLF